MFRALDPTPLVLGVALAVLSTGCLTDNAKAFKDCGCSEGQICVDPDTSPTCMAVPEECGTALATTCEDAQGAQACADKICGDADTGVTPTSVCHDEEGEIYRFFYCS